MFSDDAIDSILVTAGIVSIVGIAAGLFALYDWFTKPKKQEEPKYAKWATNLRISVRSISYLDIFIFFTSFLN